MLKKPLMILVLFVSIVLLAPLAMADLPYEKNTNVINGIVAKVNVSLVNNMQAAKVTLTSSAGELGVINLSPANTMASGLTLKAGKQSLKISLMSFGVATNTTLGTIILSGEATDLSGKKITPFEIQLAEWSN